MPQDKFTALWVSHSSISDFLECPRTYFLKNIYRDPHTGHKIQLVSPPLALGQIVHEIIEALSVLPVEKRFEESLIAKFDKAWKKVSGKKGGFHNGEVEKVYFERGREMIHRVMEKPGVLAKKAVKIKEELPHFWLSEEENIILCGKIDWLEYLPEEKSVHIIDFKTSKNEENPNSLQLPIYHSLTHHTQTWPVVKVSYWYLEHSDDLSERTLPDLVEAEEKILKIAKQIKLSRELKRFKCPQGEKGCPRCRPYEKILKGEAKLVGTDEFKRDIYILRDKTSGIDLASEIL